MFDVNLTEIDKEELNKLYEHLKGEYFTNYIFDLPCVHEGFTYKVVGESLVAISFDDTAVVNGKVTVPLVFDSIDFVNELGQSLFIGNKNVKELDLGRITVVKDRMFQNCDNLEKVVGNFVISINDYAFDNCITLREVNFPLAIQLGNNCFAKNLNLREAIFPSAKVVGNGAFYNCKNLVKADLHGVRFVANNYSNQNMVSSVFEGCERLSEVDVSGAFAIGPKMFYGCASLKELRIPLTRVIYEEALAGCLQLDTLYIDNLSGFKAKSLLSCDNLQFINYYGTRERWNNILIGDVTELDVIKKVQVTLDYKDPET